MSSISQINEILRAARTRALQSGVRPRDISAPEIKTEGFDSRRPSIAETIATRISMIAVADPQRRQRVFRAFLEGSLSDLVDEAAWGDPEFVEMIEKLQSAVAADGKLSAAADRVANVLLASADDGTLVQKLKRAWER